MQEKDFDFFLQNMENLYKTYGQKFIAVKNLSIIGAYESFDDALSSTLKTEELGTFLIQECFDSKEKLIHHFQGNVRPVVT